MKDEIYDEKNKHRYSSILTIYKFLAATPGKQSTNLL